MNPQVFLAIALFIAASMGISITVTDSMEKALKPEREAKVALLERAKKAEHDALDQDALSQRHEEVLAAVRAVDHFKTVMAPYKVWELTSIILNAGVLGFSLSVLAKRLLRRNNSQKVNP
jgi:hypothetical protein